MPGSRHGDIQAMLVTQVLVHIVLTGAQGNNNEIPLAPLKAINRIRQLPDIHFYARIVLELALEFATYKSNLGAKRGNNRQIAILNAMV